MAVSSSELKILLSLQDQASAGLRAVSGTIGQLGSGLHGIGGLAGGAAGAFGGLGSAAGSAAGAVGNLGSAASSAASGMGSAVTSGIAMGAAFAVVNSAIGAIGQGISTAGGAVFGFNSQLQKSTITFTAFAGSVEASQNFLDQLKVLAATTPFEFQDVLRGAQRFAGMGLEMDKIIPIMRDVSTVAQAMGAGAVQINEINLALSQIVAFGKTRAQEMNQLANAGIPAWQILATAMHKTVGEVMDLSEKGQISAAMFLNAFHDAADDPRMKELGLKMNQSFDTAMSNIHDRLQFFTSDAGKAIFSMATDIANTFANILGTPAISGLGQGINAVIQDALKSMAPLGDIFNEAFRQLQAGNVTDALSGLVSNVVAFGDQMFGGGVTLITSLAGGMLAGFGAVIQAAADIAAAIAGFFIGASPPPEGALSSIDQGGKTLMETYVGGMAGGLGNLGSITQGVADAFGNVNKTMTLDEGRAGLQAAAGNAAALKLAAQDADGVLRDLGGILADIETHSQALKFAADDVKTSYEGQIDPLQRALDVLKNQNDMASKQLDIQDRIRDAELHRAELQAQGDPTKRADLQAQIDANNEKLKGMRFDQQQADIEKQIADAKKGGKDTGSLQARLAELEIQRQNNDLEKQQAGLVDKTALAEIKKQQDVQKAAEDARKTNDEIAKLQREQQMTPLEDAIKRLKQEEIDRLAPINAQVKAYERERAEVEAQRKTWQALKSDISAATAEIEKAKGGAGGGGGGAAGHGAASLGGGLAGLKIPGQPLTGIDETAKKAAAGWAASFRKGIEEWFAHEGPGLIGGAVGGVIGATFFGPLGGLAGAAFGSAFTKDMVAKFPDLGKQISDKLAVVNFALQAFGKVLSGQDQYLIPLREALKTLVPPAVAGAILGLIPLFGQLRDAVGTVAQVFQGNWLPSDQIDPFVNKVGIVATWFRDDLPKILADGLPGIAAQLGLWGAELWAWIAPMIPPMLAQLGALKDQALAWVGAQLPGWFEAMQKWALELWTWIAPKIPDVLSQLGALKDQATKWVGDNAEAFGQTWKDQWSPQLADWVTTGLPLTLGKLDKEYLTGIDNWVKGNAKNITAQFTEFGILAAAGIVAGLVSKLPDFLELGGTLGEEIGKGIATGTGRAFQRLIPMMIENMRQEWLKSLTGNGFPAPTINVPGTPPLPPGVPWAPGTGNPRGGPDLGQFRPDFAAELTAAQVNGQLAGQAYIENLAAAISGGDAGVAEAVRAIVTTALKYGIDPAVALAAAKAESGLNPRAVGDQGHSVGLFQLHDQGQGAGMSTAQRQDPWINAETFLSQHAAEYANLVAQGLSGPELAKVWAGTAEVSVRQYWERYAQAYSALSAQFGPELAGKLMAATTPTAAAATQAAQPFKTALDYVFNAVANAGGADMLPQLQAQLVGIAASMGVEGAAGEAQKMAAGIESSGVALANVADAMKSANPQIAELVHQLYTGQIDAQQFALSLLAVMKAQQDTALAADAAAKATAAASGASGVPGTPGAAPGGARTAGGDAPNLVGALPATLEALNAQFATLASAAGPLTPAFDGGARSVLAFAGRLDDTAGSIARLGGRIDDVTQSFGDLTDQVSSLGSSFDKLRTGGP